jgi:hypothetical protein
MSLVVSRLTIQVHPYHSNLFRRDWIPFLSLNLACDGDIPESLSTPETTLGEDT